MQQVCFPGTSLPNNIAACSLRYVKCRAKAITEVTQVGLNYHYLIWRLASEWHFPFFFCSSLLFGVERSDSAAMQVDLWCATHVWASKQLFVCYKASPYGFRICRQAATGSHASTLTVQIMHLFKFCKPAHILHLFQLKYHKTNNVITLGCKILDIDIFTFYRTGKELMNQKQNCGQYFVCWC